MPAEPDSTGDDSAGQNNAERAVAATTDSYGGPVSDQELAQVYLPAGQEEVEGTEPALGGPDDAPDDAPEKRAVPTGIDPPD